jgi:hypothetical protein
MTIISLGWLLTGNEDGGMMAEPNPSKMDLLAESTGEVCANRFVDVVWIETITSLWKRLALMVR